MVLQCNGSTTKIKEEVLKEGRSAFRIEEKFIGEEMKFGDIGDRAYRLQNWIFLLRPNNKYCAG